MKGIKNIFATAKTFYHPLISESHIRIGDA